MGYSFSLGPFFGLFAAFQHLQIAGDLLSPTLFRLC